MKPNLTEFQSLLIDHLIRIAISRPEPIDLEAIKDLWIGEGDGGWLDALEDVRDLTARGLVEVVKKPSGRKFGFRISAPRSKTGRLRRPPHFGDAGFKPVADPDRLRALLGVLVLALLVLVGCTGGAQIGNDILPASLGVKSELLYYRAPDTPEGNAGARYVVLGHDEAESFNQAARTARTWIRFDFLKVLSGDWSTLESERIRTDGQVDTLEIQTDGANQALEIETGARLEEARIGLLPDQSP